MPKNDLKVIQQNDSYAEEPPEVMPSKIDTNCVETWKS